MIDFLKYKFVYFLISAFFLGIGFYSILTFGFKYSIDFVGGTSLEYKSGKEIKKELLLPILAKKEIVFFSELKNKDVYSIRLSAIDDKQEQELRQDLEKKVGGKIIQLKFETVGPALGRETLNKTIIASLIAILGILLYMSFSFANLKYGLAAVLAMVHDFFIVIGMYSLMCKYLGAEVDTLFITAILTTMSFSVHDTIVVFDKIREYKKTQNLPLSVLANKALTETIVRSLNNSLTIILMLLSLVLLGGESIRFFAATLLIGTLTGTYSSPFIATPILYFLEKKNN